MRFSRFDGRYLSSLPEREGKQTLLATSMWVSMDMSFLIACGQEHKGVLFVCIVYSRFLILQLWARKNVLTQKHSWQGFRTFYKFALQVVGCVIVEWANNQHNQRNEQISKSQKFSFRSHFSLVEKSTFCPCRIGEKKRPWRYFMK